MSGRECAECAREADGRKNGDRCEAVAPGIGNCRVRENAVGRFGNFCKTPQYGITTTNKSFICTLLSCE
ncbi:unnamed protein product [Strongylus vulgaris]|uniref:Uncharacterized protein n=1 Tax=Strongylus vulgaris TaxID=40348 RepID=A0A3P7IHW9_STRVU|nr:unnamed protein product [Strongylus vulgaris]